MFGCTDPTATNYDVLAGCDDGSCLAAYGCTDPAACNYSPESTEDLMCYIPSIVDGLKTSQRKILYAAFLRPLTKEIKVAQFSGYVSEKCFMPV